MANRTEKTHWFGRDKLKKSQEIKYKIPNITDELLDCITINACQAKPVKLNYFDLKEVFSFKKKLYVELKFC